MLPSRASAHAVSPARTRIGVAEALGAALGQRVWNRRVQTGGMEVGI